MAQRPFRFPPNATAVCPLLSSLLQGFSATSAVLRKRHPNPQVHFGFLSKMKSPEYRACSCSGIILCMVPNVKFNTRIFRRGINGMDASTSEPFCDDSIVTTARVSSRRVPCLFLVVVLRTGWNHRNSKFSPPPEQLFYNSENRPPGKFWQRQERLPHCWRNGKEEFGIEICRLG